MQLINKKYRKNPGAILVSFFVLVGFSYAILAAEDYQVEDRKYGKVLADEINLKEAKSNGMISLEDIVVFEEGSDKFTYIVQPWDNLSSIAYQFWTTAENIKSINNLRSEIIRPWQKLTISEEQWLIYEIKDNTTIQKLADEYELDIEKLKELNYITDNNYELNKGDELFIAISTEQAKKVGIIKVPEKPSTPTSPVYNAPQTNYTYNGSSIIKRRYYAPNIQNGFFRWHCTRYVAIKKFPYMSKNKQKKLWWGNAKYWYDNARKAWYSVGQAPQVGSIVVIKVWGRNYYYAWHVAIVLDIDRTNQKLLVEEMNARWRFFVTKRWIPIDNRIVWYIYY